MVTLTEINDSRTTGYEKVVRVEDRDAGLVGFIAVHNSKMAHAKGGLGISLGGLRMHPYETEEQALTDVLRLSEGMTQKSAAANNGAGGAKSVIIADPATLTGDQRRNVLHAMAEALNQFAKQFPESTYVAAEDVGTRPDDMEIINEKTTHVAGLPYGEFDGNPSPYTAAGVLAAMKEMLGVETMAGKRVAVSGVGNVGGSLAEMLHAEGATLVIADKDDGLTPSAKAEALKAKLGERVTTALSGEIHKQDVDVYAPCAMGASLNDKTIPEIKATYIIGAANNQLEDRSRHGKMLHDTGKMYGPDFVVNSGGVNAIALEIKHRREVTPLTRAEILANVNDTVRANVRAVMDIAKDRDIPLSEAGDALAKDRLAAADQGKAGDRSWGGRTGGRTDGDGPNRRGGWGHGT